MLTSLAARVCAATIWILFYFTLQTLSNKQQSQPNTCDFPVTAKRLQIIPLAGTRAPELMKDLSASDLIVHLAGHPASLLSATIDDTPKRIILVLDRSKGVEARVWEEELSLARELLECARAADRFLLLVIGGDGTPREFAAPEIVLGRLLQRLTPYPRLRGQKETKYMMPCSQEWNFSGLPSSATRLFLSAVARTQEARPAER
jgi:hypothetical protein